MGKIVDIARFRARREAAGLTQEKLADISGVTKAAISHIECGRRKHPRYETITALNAALETAEKRRKVA